MAETSQKIFRDLLIGHQVLEIFFSPPPFIRLLLKLHPRVLLLLAQSAFRF